MPGTLALAYPPNFKNVTTDPNYDFYVNSYFRVIWAMPILVAVIQQALLMTCFANESPVYLKEKGKEEELLAVMKKFYEPNEIRNRLDQLNNEAQNQEGSEEAQEETIKQTFMDPKIRGAAWVGFWLASFQQLTGCNAIFFYSGQLFVPDPTTSAISTT